MSGDTFVRQRYPWLRSEALSVGLFLALNGWRLAATQVEATHKMIGVASGAVDEPAFAAWLRAHAVARA